MDTFKPFPKPIATLFFFIGLFSAISFRLIILVQHAHPSYIRIFWYIAVITNLIFFVFRYHVTCKRKHAIHQSDLISKLHTNAPLEQTDRNILLYLLTSIDRSRENLNYLSISILSVLAIIIDVLLSLK